MSFAWYVWTWCFWTFLPIVTGTKGGAIYHHLPACYGIGQQVIIYDEFYRCNNPLYTLCRFDIYQHICCGPNHHCCTHYNYPACCRDESWNGYEISAVVTGGLAWVAILIVLATCLWPTVVRQITRCIRKFWKPKVHPKMELAVSPGYGMK